MSRLCGEGHAIAIGAAWAAQEVPTVPHDRYDQPLDWMLTEREIFQLAEARP